MIHHTTVLLNSLGHLDSLSNNAFCRGIVHPLPNICSPWRRKTLQPTRKRSQSITWRRAFQLKDAKTAKVNLLSSSTPLSEDASGISTFTIQNIELARDTRNRLVVSEVLIFFERLPNLFANLKVSTHFVSGLHFTPFLTAFPHFTRFLVI